MNGMGSPVARRSTIASKRRRSFDETSSRGLEVAAEDVHQQLVRLHRSRCFCQWSIEGDALSVRTA